MSGPHRLSLKVLDTVFDIQSDDHRWIELLSILWSPFIVDSQRSPSEAIEVTTGPDYWTVTFFGVAKVMFADPWLVAAEIRNAIVGGASFQPEGLICLHAGVVARGKEAALLIGPPGVGKTTLTLEMVQAGWDYCSDDLAPIEVDGGRVRPVPKPLNIKSPPSWNEVLALWEPPAWLPRPVKSFLVPGSAFNMPSGAPLVPRHLAFLRFAPGETGDVRGLSQGMATAVCGMNVRNPGGASLPVVARLARRAEAAEVVFASPEEGLRLLKGWTGTN